MRVEYDFLRVGSFVEPRRGHAYVNVGNQSRPGVIERISGNDLRRRANVRSILRAAAILGMLAIVGSAFAQGVEQVKFIYAAKRGEDTSPDETLMNYLQGKMPPRIKLEDSRRYKYDEAIKDVLTYSKNGTPFVARLTPYAYIAAELQGAELEVLATYISRTTNADTYHSYFVVRAEAYPTFSAQPTLRDVTNYLSQNASAPRTFVFHDKFSTSSYFVPSMFFRSKGIFHMSESDNESLIPITVRELTGGQASELITMVAAGHADIAAVWDLTIKSLEKEEAKKLRFIQLPTPLPNDLLVCSKKLAPAGKKEMRAAFSGGKKNACPQNQPNSALKWRAGRTSTR